MRRHIAALPQPPSAPTTTDIKHLRAELAEVLARAFDGDLRLSNIYFHVTRDQQETAPGRCEWCKRVAVKGERFCSDCLDAREEFHIDDPCGDGCDCREAN